MVLSFGDLCFLTREATFGSRAWPVFVCQRISSPALVLRWSGSNAEAERTAARVGRWIRYPIEQRAEQHRALELSAQRRMRSSDCPAVAALDGWQGPEPALSLNEIEALR
jgi:hypothetical protein